MNQVQSVFVRHAESVLFSNAFLQILNRDEPVLGHEVCTNVVNTADCDLSKTKIVQRKLALLENEVARICIHAIVRYRLSSTRHARK